jgi:hypothetical protein
MTPARVQDTATRRMLQGCGSARHLSAIRPIKILCARRTRLIRSLTYALFRMESMSQLVQAYGEHWRASSGRFGPGPEMKK